jgi:hypothetical protein
MKRKTAAHVLFWAWTWAFTHVAAATSSFSMDVRGYDLESLMWAAVMSLFGGALRTIFTLATDTAVVQSVAKESSKDAVVAIIAGVIAYIGVEAVRASGWLPVPSELRFAVIVFAGWSRLSFFGWLNKIGSQITDAVATKIFSAVGVAAPPEVQEATKPKPFQEK